ncbi:MAG: hypothetical protein Fur0024_5610 [Patescibacteria group bacterium]
MKNKIAKFKEKYGFILEMTEGFFPILIIFSLVDILINLSGVAIPFFSKFKIDQIENQNTKFFEFNFHSPLGFFLFIIAVELFTMIMISISNRIKTWFSDLISYKVDLKSKIKLFEKFFEFDYGVFLNPKSQSLFWSVSSLSWVIRRIVEYVFSFFQIFIEVSSVLTILVFIDKKIIPIFILTAIISGILRKKRWSSDSKRRIENMPTLRRNSSLDHALTSNFHRLVISGGTKNIIEQQINLIEEKRKIAIQDFKYNSIFSLAEDFVGLTSQAIIFSMLGHLALIGEISIGTFGMILSYGQRISSTFSKILDFDQKRNELLIDIAKIRFIWKLKSKLNLLKIDKKIEKIDGNIIFENVNFTYPRFSDLELRYIKETIESIKISKKSDWITDMKKNLENFIAESEKPNEQILSNISLKLEKNKITALVGRNGSGKTTITNLILRGFDVNSGSIKIGKDDLLSVDPDIIRSSIAILQQEPFFMHNFSIKENLLIGANRQISDNEIWEVLEKLEMKKFVENSPKGLDTTGDDDFQPSGGQKQMLAIARVLIQNRPIIIFDEGTNQLDAEKEAEVLKILQSIKKDRVILFITHRITTAKKADKIYTIDSGRIIENGTHEELIRNKNGIYKKFWNLQVVK